MMPAFLAGGAYTPRRAFEAGAAGQLAFRFPDDFLTHANGQPVQAPVGNGHFADSRSSAISARMRSWLVGDKLWLTCIASATAAGGGPRCHETPDGTQSASCCHSAKSRERQVNADSCLCRPVRVGVLPGP